MFNWRKNKTEEQKVTKVEIVPAMMTIKFNSIYGIRVMRASLVMYRWPVTNMNGKYLRTVNEWREKARFCWTGKPLLRKDAGWIHSSDSDFAPLIDE